jgi:cation transport regulator ChaC
MDDKERRTRLLFSYGSNGRQQLRGRLQLPAQVATHAASLRGYQRFFCGYSHNWRGGYASVQRCEGGVTNGHVVELTDAEFRVMDDFEGGYSVHEVTVNMHPDGRPMQAWTYISDWTTFQQPPSPAYLTAIHIMLREHWQGPIVIDQRRVAPGGKLEASFPHSSPTPYDSSRTRSTSPKRAHGRTPAAPLSTLMP